MRERVWVRWSAKDAAVIERIRQRFGMPRFNTLNGLTPCEIEQEDMPLLREVARRGFLSIITERK